MNVEAALYVKIRYVQNTNLTKFETTKKIDLNG